MKALFLVFHGFAPYNGISKKITYQMSAFESIGLNIKLCYLMFDENNNQVRMIDNNQLISYGRGLKAKILKRIEYGCLYNYILENDIHYVYMRYDHNANPFTIYFLSRLRSKGVIIDMEIPTYPYDREYDNFGLYDKTTLFIDRIFRNILAKYLHRIVTFSDYDIIFGKETIKISNGIDFSKIKIKKLTKHSNTSINLIGVADIHFWHGFDRLVAGLANYYNRQQNVDVYFHIVGGGIQEELNKIIDIVRKGKLENYVIFHGPLWGENLDDIFDKSDFGIASLARHRSAITKIKTLKSREYAARGIPFIYSEIDEDFENMPYIIKAAPDETAIDINSIVEFCFNNKFDPQEIRASIEGKLSWETQMKIVVDDMHNK